VLDFHCRFIRLLAAAGDGWMVEWMGAGVLVVVVVSDGLMMV
jgi:hypothetical protein